MGVSRHSFEMAKVWTTPPLTSSCPGPGRASNDATFCFAAPPPPTPPWKWQATHDFSL